MDELDISGKRYISSKRAAKENRYHVDYIGQLIRAGKIIGSKVGRTWYVEVESLDKYLGQEHVPVTNKIVAQNYEPQILYKEPAPVPTVEHSVQPVATEHIVIQKQIEPTPNTSTHSLKYLSDDEPLLPRVGRVEHKIEIKRQEVPQTTPLSAQHRSQRHDTRHSMTPGTVYADNKTIINYVIAIVGAIAFIGGLGLSYYLHYDTIIGDSNVKHSVHF